MLELTILVIVMVFFVIDLIYIKNTLASLNFLSKGLPLTARRASRKLTVVIPVLNEQKIIADTVVRFNKLAGKYQFSVLYITTEKEGSATQNQTGMIIRHHLGPESTLLHCPGVNGGKAAQVNFALKVLQSNAKKEMYIGIFDADSDPDEAAFEYIFQDRDFPDIYQMPALYNKNFESVKWLSKANAVFQTRWALCYEIAKWRRWAAVSERPPVMYLVGHGLFIRGDKNFFFDEHTIAEDIEFGYRASAAGRTLKVLPYFDRCTVPESSLSNIFQTSRWFYGEMTMYKYVLTAVRDVDKPVLYLIQSVWRYLKIMQWPLGPILVIASIVYCLLAANVILLILLSLNVVLYVLVLHMLTSQIIAVPFQIYPYLVVKSVQNCLGPMHCIWKSVVRGIVPQKLEFFKVER